MYNTYSLYTHTHAQHVMQLWQSWVEIEHYSVAYFDHITAFVALLRGTSVKGGTHMHCVNMVSIHEFTQLYEPRPMQVLC